MQKAGSDLERRVRQRDPTPPQVSGPRSDTALSKRIYPLQRLLLLGPAPIGKQLLLVERGPLDDEAQRSRREVTPGCG